MNSYAVAWRKAARTVLQLVASGGLTALVNTLAGGLTPNAKALGLGIFAVAVAYAQNALEASGAIPTMLPTQPRPSLRRSHRRQLSTNWDGRPKSAGNERVVCHRPRLS